MEIVTLDSISDKILDVTQSDIDEVIWPRGWMYWKLLNLVQWQSV